MRGIAKLCKYVESQLGEGIRYTVLLLLAVVAIIVVVEVGWDFGIG